MGTCQILIRKVRGVDKFGLEKSCHAQQVEVSRRKRNVREGKKSKPADQVGSYSGRGSFGIQNRPEFKRHLEKPTSYKNTNVKESNDRNCQPDSKACDMCGRSHGGECLVGIHAFYGCSKSCI